MSDDSGIRSRRDALKCMAYGGAGTVFVLSGGVFAPIDLALASADKTKLNSLGKPLFVQISDTHIGFNKEANPDVNETPTREGRSASTPIVVFAHMPLWTIYEPWGWGTGDSNQLMSYLGRFGSVTVLNGHIHQIVQKAEGHIAFHTARSTADPQPAAGVGSGPGPLKVSAKELPTMLGVSSASFTRHARSLALTDTAIG